MIEALILLTAISPADTTFSQTRDIDEVVVVSAVRQGGRRSLKGQTASVDEHIAQLDKVNLIRRGAYAQEPVVNNMQTERVSTTIDGMKIFYACTDKMDPVTSYVESGNLQSISLNSGLDGNPQATGNIGGSLDLKLRRVGFDNDPFHLNVNAGHEWNGHLQVYGADAAVSSHRFYTNFGSFYRHADDYRSGGNERVTFSQFQKLNAFANVGWRLSDGHSLEGSFIYDVATNVGYPALNMDVKKAEGVIGSLTYRWLLPEWAGWQSVWETKAYYNHITHVMDDTKRPDVEIHMDMPGKSQTGGLYSLLRGSKGRHDASVNYDIYYNRLFADMTMYPGGAAPMYMVTWPDVGTLNTGVALNDNMTLASNQSVRLSAKLAWQTQRLNNQEGYDALRVFFPGMERSYNQTTGRVAAGYVWSPRRWTVNVGVGWGSRAPSVTEAYGYYLNNTFDQYDYIGNPHLKNESAFELNAALKYAVPSVFSASLDIDAFLFSNYIIGEFERRLSPMTVGAEGVKVYQNEKDVRIINVSASADWQVLPSIKWQAKLAYAVGEDAYGHLPLIAPLSYETKIEWHKQRATIVAELLGNARQTHYGARYGETPTPAYAIVNMSAQYGLAFDDVSVTLRAGVENLLDKLYSTYADWNKIPQKGRNIYFNVGVSL